MKKILALLIVLGFVFCKIAMAEELPKFTFDLNYVPGIHNIGGATVDSRGVFLKGELQLYPYVRGFLSYYTAQGKRLAYNESFVDVEAGLKYNLSFSGKYSYPLNQCYLMGGYRASWYNWDIPAIPANYHQAKFTGLNASGWGIEVGKSPDYSKRLTAYGSIGLYPSVIVHNADNPQPGLTSYYRAWKYNAGVIYQYPKFKEMHIDFGWRSQAHHFANTKEHYTGFYLGAGIKF